MPRFIAIALVLLYAIMVYSEVPPTFPDKYEVSFSQTAKIAALSGHTTGRIYLDATNNKQLITRQNGQYDRYCGTVFKFTNTPCNHYVVNNVRYLDFPVKKYCCFCCDSSHGCGITSPDWLVKSNATFQGYQKLTPSEQPSAKWQVKGLQDNLYYHKNDTLKTPRRLFQVSDDLMDFNDYKVGIKDQSVFNLPNYCKDKCGLTTICASLRGEKSELKRQ